MNYIDKVKIENLKDGQKDLAELIGIENYIKVVKYFGGSSIYIYRPNTLSKAIRDDQIKKDFNGGNYKELSNKYNLSVNHIREILDKDKLSRL